MKELKERILKEGICLPGDVLKVDAFINHQIDPLLTQLMGKEFCRIFADAKIDKIVTIEASGIAMAFAAACELNVPLVFARKKKSVLLQEAAYTAKIQSFTQKEEKEVTILRKFLKPGEKVLIIDDFLADGNAALGLCDIVEQAGCKVVGIGIAIEKSFMPGADRIKAAGYRLESLARVKSLDDCKITFMED